MRHTVLSLRKALHEPQRYFATLGTLSCPEHSIVCSTFFAECRIEWQGRDYMLYMPLTSHAMRRIERFVPHKLHLSSAAVPRLTILRNEMCCKTECEEFRADIVLEELPKRGFTLRDALSSLASHDEAEELIRSLDRLEQQIKTINVSHNNIRIENILLNESDNAHLIRWYYATCNGDGNDSDAIAKIKEQITKQSNDMVLNDFDAQYVVESQTNAQIEDVRFLHEGLIAFQSGGLWGFMDGEGAVVIEPCYLWVGDFREGRAEVESEEGMGLIDKDGRMVIPTKYQIVDYDPLSGNSEVRQNDEWALFDYQGQMIRNWGEHELRV